MKHNSNNLFKIFGHSMKEAENGEYFFQSILNGGRKMKRKMVTYVLTGALAMGIIGASPALAEKGPGEGHPHHKMNRDFLEKRAEELGIEAEGKETEQLAKEVHEAKIIEKAKEMGIETEGKEVEEVAKELRETHIMNKAKELGIKTDGKDMEDIANEIRETLIMNKAKELNIDTEGKTLDELGKEVFEVGIKNEAKKLGIETEGKDMKQLAREVIDKKTLQTAKKLGIDAKDKTTQQLMEEIFTNYKDEAKKQKLFPFDEERDFHFMRHKEEHPKQKGSE